MSKKKNIFKMTDKKRGRTQAFLTGLGFFEDVCDDCRGAGNPYGCFIYESAKKQCFRCYTVDREERRAVILRMPDIEPWLPVYHPASILDFARIDDLWDRPLSYTYLV